MTLTDSERVRFARHLLLAEIGEAGQERLSQSAVRIAPEADAATRAQCRDLLSRAGVTVTGDGEARESRELTLPTAAELSTLDPSLREAARAFFAAFAAVESIKSLTRIGRPTVAPSLAILVSEDL